MLQLRSRAARLRWPTCNGASELWRQNWQKARTPTGSGMELSFSHSCSSCREALSKDVSCNRRRHDASAATNVSLSVMRHSQGRCCCSLRPAAQRHGPGGGQAGNCRAAAGWQAGRPRPDLPQERHPGRLRVGRAVDQELDAPCAGSAAGVQSSRSKEGHEAKD